jgi:hypothetical protein
MSKSFDTQGLIHSIGETIAYGNNGFTKREFVIKVTGDDENPDYPNYLALELIKDKCALMDNFAIGDAIQAQFNLSGRLWSGNGKPEKCFVSLQAWRVQKAEGSDDGMNQEEPSYPQPSDFDDDVPF